MQDPHVVALQYRLETDETVTYDSPPPLEWLTDAFDMRLADEQAVFTMKDHYASVEAARECVERHLHDWNLLMELDYGGPQFRLVFDRADIIDRDPPPPGSPDVRAMGVAALESVEASGTATVHVTRSRYPDPPITFRASALVEDLWYLYDRYRQDRERLLPMAYSCLSLLFWTAGNKKDAAKKYGVSYNVLTTLGQLSSFRGDARSARKLEQGSVLGPLTTQETLWIETVLKALIRRAGEVAASGPDVPRCNLTMEDFPRLEKR